MSPLSALFARRSGALVGR
ncbi:hypothetical protein GBAR_LOCUS26831 [Geodia barretti]|uniref:Uncharacterized protein n=1 Tax=Geodia barretti TaxID=519541 RepID=A0AA35TIG9_GEOBA|nr:hypothetical protein GBAR_LOCUS26831 [Geodia barretti]